MRRSSEQVTGSAVLLIIINIALPVAEAVIGSPFPFERINPAASGERIQLVSVGGPFDHWLEDTHGYVVCPEQKSARERTSVRLGKYESSSSVYYEETNVTSYYYCGVDSIGHLKASKDLPVIGESNSNPAKSSFDKAHHRKLRADRISSSDIDQENHDASLHRHPVTRKLQQLPTTGVLINTVILVRFQDHIGRTLPSEQDLEALLNGEEPSSAAPTGSVKQYYLENSYGQLTIESKIVPWITLSRTEAECAAGKSGVTRDITTCLREALDLAREMGYDFAAADSNEDGFADMVSFIHSGYGAEWTGDADKIWSHKFGLFRDRWTDDSSQVIVHDYLISTSLWGSDHTRPYEMCRLGTITHEVGHFFNLPDMYGNRESLGKGLGSWSLMGNSWGFDQSQRYPPHLDPWSKIQLGWTKPNLLTSAENGIEIKPSATDNDYYMIRQNLDDDEYFLVENRQSMRFEPNIPQSGILIYHIDDSKGRNDNEEGFPGQPGWPENGRHYRVALLPADGRYRLERGWQGTAGDVWHDSQNSNSSLWPGPSIFPNTDSYKDGIIHRTGFSIQNISVAQEVMTFDFIPNTPTLAPTNHYPTQSPLSFATSTPTERPSKNPTSSPISTPPTASPMSLLPTATPNLETDHSGNVEIVLWTDSFPEETGLRLTQQVKGKRQKATVLPILEFEPGSLTIPRHQYVSMVQLDPGAYTLEVTDMRGDGLCCRYGAGNVTVTVDGTRVAYGAIFAKQSQHAIVVGSDSTTDSPHDSESTPIPLDASFVTIRVSYDDYPYETSWKLFLSHHEKPIAKEGVNHGYEPGQVAETNLRLPEGDYDLQVEDSFGDGMCCDYGKGGFEVIIMQNNDGEDMPITINGGSFRSSENVTFSIP